MYITINIFASSPYELCCYGYRLDDVDPIQKGIKQLLSVLPL